MERTIITFRTESQTSSVRAGVRFCKYQDNFDDVRHFYKCFFIWVSNDCYYQIAPTHEYKTTKINKLSDISSWNEL